MGKGYVCAFRCAFTYVQNECMIINPILFFEQQCEQLYDMIKQMLFLLKHSHKQHKENDCVNQYSI